MQKQRKKINISRSQISRILKVFKRFDFSKIARSFKSKLKKSFYDPKILKEIELFEKKRFKKINFFHKIHFHLKPHYPLVQVLALSLIVFQAGIIINNQFYSKTPVLGLKFDGRLVGSPLLAKSDLNFYTKESALASERSIEVHAADYEGKIVASKTGLEFDPKVISAEVYQYGRSENFLLRIWHEDLAFFGMADVKISPTGVNQKKLAEYVKELEGEVIKTPQNATFSYQAGKLKVLSDQPGYVVDTKKTIMQLEAMSIGSDVVFEVPLIQKTADITTAELNPLVPEVSRVVAAPFQVTAQSQTITIPPEQLVSYIRPVVQDPKKNQVSLTIDQKKVGELVNQISSKVNIQASSTVVDADDNSVITQGKQGQMIEGDVANLLSSDILSRTAQGSTQKGTAVSLKVVTVVPTVVKKKRPMIYLSFDDVPNASTAPILDALSQYSVHAIFFVIGYLADDNPALLRRVVAGGHTVGNHSYDHPVLTSLNSDDVRTELAHCEQSVKDITGISMSVWRPPFFYHNATTDSVAASLGLRLDLGTGNINDWNIQDPATITRRVLANARPNQEIVLHSQPQTAQALPGIINGLRSKGYKIK